MTLLGLDVGDVRIGVALTDPEERIAFPQGAIMRGAMSFDELNQIVEAEHVSGIVVGLPRRLNGTLGPQAEATQSFMRDWEAYLEQQNISRRPQIIWWDERLSSVAAERAIRMGTERGKRRRGRRPEQREADRRQIDATAATLILQSYLDYRRNRPDGDGEPDI